ncbi:exodeoxyribonuclease III [Ascodesmis nigricans]|uniref:DNA-(apurinic or apyrimidinic site) endonuclease 2 n=1 Tax=Ascodesmis nigricans TaxID=341454 RepID=A0A4S2MVB8_9PEZI|nr:exodeoxyribonuclease III [Ascodesmis nigricans]
MVLRLTTWNVNGIKNPFGYHPWSSEKSFKRMFDILEADILCFQELKIQPENLTDEMVLVPGWDSYFTFPKHKKGYSGVAVYTRNSKCQPVKAEEGITGVLEVPGKFGRSYKSLDPSECIGGYPDLSREEALLLDSEGRALVLDFGAFVLIGTYCPASTDPSRDDFRIAFVETLFERARRLIVEHGRRVVIMGDLNISRQEIDSAESIARMNALRAEGYENWIDTPTRAALDRLVEPNPEGVMIDTCREFWPTKTGMYTCWNVKLNKRPGNAGDRIDYILASSDMKPWLCEANIQEGLMGSDHCPVYTIIKDTVVVDQQERNILDLVFPPGTYEDGVRQDKVPMPSPPPLCRKEFSEFKHRRSIKDMFSNMSSKRSTPANLPQLTLSSLQSSPVKSNKRGPGHMSSQPSPSKAETKKIKRASAPQSNSKKSSGQQSLKGFFAPKNSKEKIPTPNDTPPTPSQIDVTGPEASQSASSEPMTQPEESNNEEIIIDPSESREKWGKIFTPRPPPKCSGHGENCKQMITKKPGPNNGRAFWMCARPIGPGGEAEMNSGRVSEWRCNYFMWASEVYSRRGFGGDGSK